MTAPESALDVAREVAPGLRWSGGADWLCVESWAEARLVMGVVLCLRTDGSNWIARCDGVCGWSSHGPDPRACLRAVLDEVHQWALDVARATVPAGYQLVTACVPPEIPGEDPDPVV